MSAPAAEFNHGEIELAAATGIAVKLFQKIRARELRQGVEWDLNGQRVAYSPAGVAAVLQKITGGPPQVTTELLKKSALDGGPAEPPLIGTVKRLAPDHPNPRLLKVELPDKGLVPVMVRTTKNFKRGMQVPLRATAAGGYELARRLPRFPGRW